MSFMKYTLASVVAVAFLFTACKKSLSPTHCYICSQYDSFARNGGLVVYPNGISDTQCNQNQDLINFYITSHMPKDTFYVNTDTVGYGWTYFRCAFYK